MKTALSEIIEEMKWPYAATPFVIKRANDLIPTDKNQIVEAFESGLKHSLTSYDTEPMTGEEYYNKNYLENGNG
jgi:hypothetical protein